MAHLAASLEGNVARDRCPERALPGPLPGAIPSDPTRIFGCPMTPNASARPFIRQRSTGPFWYGKWSRNGQPVVRALGRAWAESDGRGGWRLKRGRPPEGALTVAQAAPGDPTSARSFRLRVIRGGSAVRRARRDS